MARKKFNAKKVVDNSNWKEIQIIVRKCTEDQAKALLDYESSSKNRGQWVNRFHQRFNKLRGQREKREYAVL